MSAVEYSNMNDELLVDMARHGDRRALENLLGRLRDWVYNVIRRVLLNPQESEDATQEVLIKVATNLSRYDAERGALRTWAYRIAVNHAMNMKRGAMEQVVTSFEEYGRGLSGMPDVELSASELTRPENLLLIEEAKASCTLGMLLCLDREQRVALILADLMGMEDRASALLLDISHDAFRQRLIRARRDLYTFMDDRCGLINEKNPCRCAKKMRVFERNGWIDSDNPRFSAPHMLRLREKVKQLKCEHDDFQKPDYQEIYRLHPHFDAPEKILDSILEKFS